MRRHRSLALPLAGIYLLLILYASTYPFTGWRWPPGHDMARMAVLPIPVLRFVVDDWLNFVGYLPMGALVVAAWVRSGGRGGTALGVGILAPACLSYLLEFTQHFLPERVPSARDWILNAAGAGLGAVLTYALHAVGAFRVWQRWRDRWFMPHSAGALALIVLWPVALLFPPPVPLGLGQFFDALRQSLTPALEGTPWAQLWLAPVSRPASPSGASMGSWQAVLAMALGLLAPSLLAVAATRTVGRRVVMILALGILALGVPTLSTALNFEWARATAWWLPLAAPGLALGLACALLCTPLPERLATLLAIPALVAAVALVSQVPPDPYHAASLAAWEQGRFARFHGLAEWIGWLWPYAALAWLVARLLRRD